MKKRSKMNRILSFVLSLSLIGNDILPTVAAGDGVPEAEIIAVSEDAVSDDKASSEGQTEEADTVPEEMPVEEIAAEAEAGADVDAGDDDFVFVPGYLPVPDEPVSPAVDPAISFKETRDALNSDPSEEYGVDLSTTEARSALYTDRAFPYSHEEEWLDYYIDNYPATRDQNPYGSCWAHSAMCLAEFNLINHGKADKNIDLSELHLVYWSYNNGTASEAAGDTGDSIGFSPTYNAASVLDNGGDVGLASQGLMRQRGFADESVAPYTKAAEIAGGSRLKADTERDDSYYLKNAYKIDIEDKNNRNKIKEALIEHGAVGVSIYAAQNKSSYYYKYFNPEHAAYYCGDKQKTNHAVTIVGWDDDFPAGYFASNPGTDGAWLIRNSWSTTVDDNYFSYFWLSYKDVPLKGGWIYEVETEFPYDNHYYYDSALHGSGVFGNDDNPTNLKYYANVYKVNGDADQEELEAVTFEVSRLQNSGEDYHVEIYKNPTGSNPCSGEKVGGTGSGKLYYIGNYTVPLEKPVVLDKGDSFSVVVCFENDGSCVTIEGALKNYEGVNSTVNCETGQSFSSSNGKNWTDSAKNYLSYGYGNFVITALTKDVTREGIALSDSKLSLSTKSYTADLNAVVTDADGNTKDDAVVLWSTSNKNVITIDKTSGKKVSITAVGDGTATVTATSGEYKVSCTVTVKLSKAAKPVSNKEAGSELAFGEKIELSCDTKDAGIYYTLDGTDPTQASSKYEDGISFGLEDAGKTINIKAVTYADHYNPSDVADWEYTVEESKVGLNLSKKAITLSSNEPEVTVTAKVLNEDNSEDTDAVISWNIADSSVAVIDKVSGNSVSVTAVEEGTTVITVTSGEYEASCDVTVVFSKAEKPVSDKTEKILYVGDMISVSCATAGAKIYYTDDGTDPDTGSMFYTGKIKVTSDMVKESSITYKFRAFADYYKPSDVLTYEFSVQSRAGIVLSEKNLSLTSEKPEAKLTAVVYTDEGEEDKAAVVSYNSTDTKVVTVSEGNISAVGNGTALIIAKSGTLSANCVVSVNFTKLASPVADKADGSELKLGTELTLSSTDSVAEIYYTLDGSVPDSDSLKYTGPITIGAEYAASELVLKAVAMADHYTDSDVASYTYTVEDRSAIELSDIKISFTEAGAAKELKAVVYDAAGNISSNAAVVWSSSDEKVVTVSNGSVTAVADGNAVIKAASGRLSAECAVTVFLGERKQAVPNNIIVVPENIEFGTAGETMQLKVVVEDQYGLVIEEPSLSFDSSNKKVAAVNESGLVSALSDGKATITIKSGDVKAKCYVGVGQKSGAGDESRSAFDTVPDFSQDTLYLVAGQKFDLHYPSWNIIVITNKSVSISKKGILTAKKAGTARIASSDGSMEYNIQVIKPEMSLKSAGIKTGDTLQLSLSGINDEYPVFWYSSAPAVASVEDGEVYGISKGSAKIIAVVNGKEYSCKVMVKDILSVKFDASVKNITLSPLQSINTKIKGEWKSDSEMTAVYNGSKTAYADSIVYITSAGKITAIGVGTTVLTAPNGTEYTVTVSDPVEQVQYIAVGKKKTLKFPSVKNAKAQWESEDPGIAYVNEKGVVSTYQYTAGETAVNCTYNPYGIEGAGFTYTAVIYVEDPRIDLPSEKTNTYTLSAKTGDRIDLDFLNDDSHAVYQPVVFKSNRPAVAFVDENDVIRANEAGSAKLTARINGKSISIKVTVTAAD